MPLAIWVIVRLYRALAATFRLLADRQVLRSLPWSYIRRLPRRNAWIGVTTLSLAVAAVAIPLAATLPPAAGSASFKVGWFVALAGIASSWLRALAGWWRLRRPFR